VSRAHTAFSENAAGNFFVDDRCIDCGTCYAHAPGLFADTATHAYVARQPLNEPERRTALEALHSCPVHAIGQQQRDPLTGEVLASFPIRLEENIYFCGFANEDTFGASSYLVVRPGGNVLIDVPRPYPRLLAGIERLGGIRYIFLTHSDDIAGHDEFARHFGAERIMHTDERHSSAMEIRIEGLEAVSFADDLTIIPTPGHTKGSMCLLFRNQVLFSGDHLAAGRSGGLVSFRDACWYSWAEVKKSNERLLNFDFSRVYPGHGRRFKAENAAAALDALAALIGRM